MKTYLLILRGPVDKTPSGSERLMIALAKRLPLSPEALKTMFSNLPAIVRKDTDRANIEIFASVLTSLGAEVEISESGPATPQPTIDRNEESVNETAKLSQPLHAATPPQETAGLSIDKLMELLDADSPGEVEIFAEDTEDFVPPEIEEQEEEEEEESPELSFSHESDVITSVNESTPSQSQPQTPALESMPVELSFEIESAAEPVAPTNLDWEQSTKQSTRTNHEPPPAPMQSIQGQSIQPDQATIKARPETLQHGNIEEISSANSETPPAVAQHERHENSLPEEAPEEAPGAAVAELFAEEHESSEQYSSEANAESDFANADFNRATFPGNLSRYRSAIAATAIASVIVIVGFLNPFEADRSASDGAGLISKQAIDKFLDQYALDLKAGKQHTNKQTANSPAAPTGVFWRQQKQQGLIAVTADFLTTPDKRGYFSLVLEGSAPPKLSPEQIARGELPGAWLRHLELRNLKVEQDTTKSEAENPAAADDSIFYFTANGPSHAYLEDQKGSSRMLVSISVSGSIDLQKSLISAHWEISRNTLSDTRVNAAERLKDGSFALRYFGDLELAPLETAPNPNTGAAPAATAAQSAAATLESKPVAIDTK